MTQTTLNQRIEKFNQINESINQKVYGSDEFLKLSFILVEFRFNYIAPQFFLEKLINTEEEYFETKMADMMSKGIVDHNSMFNSVLDLKLEVNNLLINIKMSLDRIVKILSVFYKGFSPISTFGHINEDGKTKGFMSYVAKHRSEDKLLDFIFENYRQWIKLAVLPRNQIMHYENLIVEFPINLQNDEISISYRTKDNFKFNIKDLKKYSDNWYILIDEIFKTLEKNYNNKIGDVD